MDGTPVRGSAQPVRARPAAWSEHKARVRQALVDAALELFAEQGYESTSTEQVAARAGVSARTFFRYFATKESVLFFGEDDYIRSFVGVYLAQPESLSEFQAMRAAFVTLAPGVARLRERIRLYHVAVASSFLLRGKEHDNQQGNRALVARAVATRRGLAQPDESCELLAAIGILAEQRAMQRWLQGAPSRSLGSYVTAEFATLADLMGPVAQ
ncbi:transcriptional regulator, TetR family [Frankia torreyi]|uniref:Transcriptional regulator, TetR family n=1 Tax=Frankia torreyi TaxID=1856 RepID=A0A0D8B754_9ACTN|nr:MULTISPECIES: TetR family transcriptional regulator [Frankia]KJE19935.1 transcriptional regulator, TetR family [Frankia torreyi]